MGECLSVLKTWVASPGERREPAEEEKGEASTSGQDFDLFELNEVGSIEESAPIRWSCGELIGAGAFGRVYMAMNLDSGELMGVKQVSVTECVANKREDHIRALESEINVLRRLKHPNIVRYLGTERTEETLNVFLEYVPGGSIYSLLVKFGSFGEGLVRRYTLQILRGLAFLHKNKIVHRDIKGANILVDNTGVAKLADFGASRQIANLMTLDSGIKSIKGTPYWMAPEVIRQTGHGRQADVWSVGCTIIEMATGKAPWSEFTNQVSVMFHIASSKAPPEVPQHLSDEGKNFVMQCLKRDPRERPTSSQLLEDKWLVSSPETPKQGQTTKLGGGPALHNNNNNPTSTSTPAAKSTIRKQGGGERNEEGTPQHQILLSRITPLAQGGGSIARYGTNPTSRNNSAERSDSGWGSIALEDINCSMTNTETSDIGYADGTPLSKRIDEEHTILSYVRQKAEGDCERLAPRNADGSPMVSSVSPSMMVKKLSNGSISLEKHGKILKEQNSTKEEEDTEIRKSKEEIWEEELKRELEATRREILARQ